MFAVHGHDTENATTKFGAYLQRTGPLCSSSPQEFNVGTLQKYGPEERQKNLEKLVAGRVTFETDFVTALLQLRLNEMAASEDMPSLLQAVQPFNDDSGVQELNVLAPRVRDLKLPDVDLAALFLKLLIHEQLVPVLSDGAPAAEYVRTLCTGIKTMAEKRPKDASPLISIAVQEAADIAQYLLILSSDAVVTESVAVDKVRKDHKGASGLVCTAVSRSQYWRSLEAAWLGSECKAACWAADLQKVRDRLSKSPDKAAIEVAVGHLPAWRDELRHVLVAPIETLVEKAVENAVSSMLRKLDEGKIDGDVSAESVQSWLALLEHAHMMLKGSGNSGPTLYSNLCESLKAANRTRDKNNLKRHVQCLCGSYTKNRAITPRTEPSH